MRDKKKWFAGAAAVCIAAGLAIGITAVAGRTTETKPVEAAGEKDGDSASFLDWNTKADGSGKTYKEGDAIKAGDEVPSDLYAQWGYKISYDLDGGSADNPSYYRIPVKAAINLKEPTKSGYNFTGWTGSNEIDADLDQYTEAKPLTISGRDHPIGKEFSLKPGEIYQVYLKAKRTKGSIPLGCGMYYTSYTSGSYWDGYGQMVYDRDVGNGYALYHRTFRIPDGKSKAKFFVQIEQNATGGSTAWSIYDIHVTNITDGAGGIKVNDSGNKTFNAQYNYSFLQKNNVDRGIGLDQYTASNPYVHSGRDAVLGTDITVKEGEKYTVMVIAKCTKGSIPLCGGLYYTSLTTGNAWDSYENPFTKAFDVGDGYAMYYKNVTIPGGKSKAKYFLQIEQNEGENNTSWSCYGMRVVYNW